LRLHARRVADGAEQAAALERRKRTAIAILPDAVEDDMLTPQKNGSGPFTIPVTFLRQATCPLRRQLSPKAAMATASRTMRVMLTTAGQAAKPPSSFFSPLATIISASSASGR
jgi:hypothetical protein